MKIIKTLLNTLVLVTMLFFNSCTKKNSSDDGEAGIKYKLQTTNRTSVLARTTAGSIVWTSGYGYATEIKFEAESRNLEVEFKSQVPQRIDLFSGVANLGNITLPPGTYEEVEFEVELNSSNNNAALEINGHFTSGGINTPVIFRVDSPVEIEAEKENVVITDNNSYTALTSLNLSLLTRGITESMLKNAIRTNGTIVLSSTSNTTIYNIILNNLKDSDEIEFEDD